MPKTKVYYEQIAEDLKECQFRIELARRHLDHLQEKGKEELTEEELQWLAKQTKQSNQCMFASQQYMFETLIGNKVLANHIYRNV